MNRASKSATSRLTMLAAAMAFLGSSVSWAVDPPKITSGDVMDSLKTSGADRPAKPTPSFGIERPAEPLAAGSPGDVRVNVTGFKISGNTAFGEAELQGLLKDYVGRDLSLIDLTAAASRITQHYRARGYFVARAYLPKQEIGAGKIEIAVLEGRLGEVKVSMTKGARLDVKRAEAIVKAAAASGDVIRDASLERGLLLLNDLPGVEVKSTLFPGAATGTANVDVVVSEGRLLGGSVDIDNFGNRYTGQYRLGATLGLNNPFGIGDQISLRAMLSDGDLHNYRIGYAAPVNSLGTKLGFAVGRMDYELDKSLSATEGMGTADVYSLTASHPFIRTRNANLYGSASLDWKKLADDVNGAAYTGKNIHALSLGVSGDFRDGLGGGSVTSGSLTVALGDLNLDEYANKGYDAQYTRSAGNFRKVNYSLARLQRVTDRLMAYASLQGQFSSKNLDSSEKFSVGGPNGVRAYPQGEGSGDQGHILNLEMRYSLQAQPWGQPQLLAFYDYGYAQLHKDTWSGWDAGGGISNQYSLQGIGVGLNIGRPGDYSLRATYAFKVGGNDGAVGGKDADDRDPNGRFWVQGVKWF